MYCNNVKAVLYMRNGNDLMINGKDSLPADVDRKEVIKYKLYVNDAPNNMIVIPEGKKFLYMHRVMGVLNQPTPPTRYLRVGYTEANGEGGVIEEIKVENE